MCATWRDSINTYSQYPMVAVAVDNRCSRKAVECRRHRSVGHRPASRLPVRHGRKFLDREPDRLRCGDDFGPGRNAERLGDNIDSAQRSLHRGHLERVAGHFFELGVINRDSSG
jgi:hypothetical protein